MYKISKLALIVVFAATGQVAHANLDLSLETAFNWVSPVGTAPWVTASFQQLGADVQLTISVTPTLPSGGYLSSFFFNFTGNAAALSALAFSPVTNAASSISSGVNGYSADGDGKYDIKFNYGNNVTSGLSSVYNISGAGLTPGSFYGLSYPSGNSGPFYAAGQIRGVNGTGAGWIGASVAAIPEAEPYAMLLAGLGLMGWMARRRRQSLEAGNT